MFKRFTRGLTPIGWGVLSAAVLVAIAMTWALLPWSYRDVPVGAYGVVVDKPYFFGTPGVRPEPLQPGRKLLFNSSDVVLVTSTPVQEGIEFDDFVTVDNYRVDFKSRVIYEVTDPSNLVERWTLKFWGTSVAAEYASIVREEVRKYNLQQLMSDPIILKAVDDEITAKLRAFIKARGIPINIISVVLGQAKPNKPIFDQIEETARVEEERKTHIARKRTYAEREQSEAQRAKSDKAYSDNLGITKEEHLRIQLAKIQAEACEKAQACYIGIDRIVNTK